MKVSKYINEKDKSFSDFARALALPIRVRIVRLIIENGFTISRDDLYTDDFAKETVTKHLGELRSLGIIRMEGKKGHITYNIDQSRFTQMVTGFLTFFGERALKASPELVNQVVKNDSRLDLNLTDGEPASPYSHFGAFIKKHRQELHITQADLAEKINMDRGDLSRIECGKKPIPVDKLKVVSKALYLDCKTVKKEYYSYQLSEIIDESGYDESVLTSAREKFNYLSLQRNQ